MNNKHMDKSLDNMEFVTCGLGLSKRNSTPFLSTKRAFLASFFMNLRVVDRNIDGLALW